MKSIFSRYLFVAVVMILSAQYSSAEPIPTYYEELSKATYESIQAMVEPNTNLPHDRFDASIFDIMPQFAIVRSIPYTSNSSGASLESARCTTDECRYSGNYGLKFTYNMPAGQWGSYNVDSPGFNVSKAAYLEAWVKGSQGGERFEIVLWSNCQGSFPGRPNSSLITVSHNWEQRRIPLEDFQSYANLSSLCRLSIGFNDAIHPGGTIYIDNITFVDADGNRIHVPFDEETSVTNIGLYIASELSALDLGYKEYDDVLAEMNTTLMSIEALPKWQGFPQTHNHIVSLRPSTGDRCISTVDMGNFAAGLILLRQRVPELSSRVSTLLNAMEWDWLYDAATGLPYGCRYPDGSNSTWHYDWLSADSRLAHFIGIGTEKIPPGSWNNLNRTPEQPKCSGLSHFEPGWDGGGLFMAFLPAIFLDEKKNELGKSARNFMQDQICYAQQIGAPAWGWSATAMPPYGADYCGYGCMRDEILVPHASILAAESINSHELYKNLLSFNALGARQPVTDGIQTTDFGFRASLNWRTHEITTTYLVLDQGMAFLSLVNKIDNKNIRKLFCQDEITRQAIKLIPDYSKSCTALESSITVTVPNGGQNWNAGTTKKIKWKYTGNPGSRVKIDFLKGKKKIGTINSNVSIGKNGNGSYKWSINSTQQPGNYKIRVTSKSNPIYKDKSNKNFTILPAKSNGTIKIASFNLQIFGVTKAGKPEVMDVLSKTIRNFDIVAIQEIRDASQTALPALKNAVNEMAGPKYDFVVSDRLGRTTRGSSRTAASWGHLVI